MTKMNNNISKKLQMALQAAGYTTAAAFVAACAAEAESRRQAAAKAARKAAAVAAKKARDEERHAKDEARKAKAAARRTKKALAAWKAGIKAEMLANIKADVLAGKAWEALVVAQDKCDEVKRLLKEGYTIICEHREISSHNDVQELASNWVIQYVDADYWSGEAIVTASPILGKLYGRPADIYRFVGTTLEECKAATIKNLAASTAHWDSCPYTILSTRDLDLDVDDIVVDGEVKICPDCGKMSNVMDATDEDGFSVTLDEYDKYFVNEDGKYIGVLERSKCPACEAEQKVASIKEANTVEKFIKASRMGAIAHCKNCGAELYALPYHFGPVTYEITLKEGQVFVHDVSSKELCSKCATEYYGGGLDGVKKTMSMALCSASRTFLICRQPQNFARQKRSNSAGISG